MGDFITNHWDEALAVLAIIVTLLPLMIKALINLFGKIHYVFLDYHFVYNVSARIIKGGKAVHSEGCALILALNMFLYGKSFFPYKITCVLKMKNGSKIVAPMYVGGIGYSDTEDPPREHDFQFEDKHNMSTNRLISVQSDNIRIIPFFITDVNLKNFDGVEKVIIRFKGRIFRKKVVLNPERCMHTNIIGKYDFVK
ncbi:MAG: hypothetical protein E7587_06800 [Ruminococcaceae bacterium]|nr:hypothetical protein [Oscillospiraceae bacterium]